MELRYTQGEKVQVYDISRKRWYKAVTDYLAWIDEVQNYEAWFCTLNNGNKGSFDHNHIRKESK